MKGIVFGGLRLLLYVISSSGSKTKGVFYMLPIGHPGESNINEF